MAIYPVVKGQKFPQTVVIPPRASLSEPTDRPKEAGDDLISFDSPSSPSDTRPPPPLKQKQEQEQAKSPQAKPPLDASHESTAEIQTMLASTGSRPKDGPLIDFHNDMQKSLPPASIKQSDSDESHDDDDDFVDAQEG
jgi:hypothetical protein